MSDIFVHKNFSTGLPQLHPRRPFWFGCGRPSSGRRNKKSMRTYPMCREEGCVKYSQGKGFCRAHENYRKRMGLPLGSIASIRRQREISNARLKAEGLERVVINDSAQLVSVKSSNEAVLQAGEKVTNPLIVYPNSESENDKGTFKNNDEDRNEESSNENDNENSSDENDEHETTITLSRRKDDPLSVLEDGAVFEGFERMQCVEEGCKRLGRQRNNYLCEMHHNEAVKLEREHGTKRKRSAEHVFAAGATTSSSSSSASSSYFSKAKAAQLRNYAESGLGKPKNDLQNSEKVNSVREGELLKQAIVKRMSKGDGWMPPQGTYMSQGGKPQFAPEYNARDKEEVTTGTMQPQGHPVVRSTNGMRPINLPSQPYPQQYLQRSTAQQVPGSVDVRGDNLVNGKAGRDYVSAQHVLRSVETANGNMDLSAALSRKNTSGAGISPTILSANPASIPSLSNPKAMGLPVRGTPKESTLGRGGMDPLSIELYLGQQFLLCQDARCVHGSTTSGYCPQHHRAVFGPNAIVPDMPFKAPLELPSQPGTDYVAHPMFQSFTHQSK